MLVICVMRGQQVIAAEAGSIAIPPLLMFGYAESKLRSQKKL